MTSSPYEPPSPESSAHQSAFVKASQIKPCPHCGKNVGLWPFIKAAFSIWSSRVQCGNCGSWLACDGPTGQLFFSVQTTFVFFVGFRILYAGFKLGWQEAGVMAGLSMLVLAVIVVLVAPFVRRKSKLVLIESAGS